MWRTHPTAKLREGIVVLKDSLFRFEQIQKSRALGGRHFDWVQWDLLERNARLYGAREALADTYLGTAYSERRRRTWQEAYHQVNTLIASMLRQGLRPGATLLSHLPSILESTYLDWATSKLGAAHAGLNVDLGKAETIGAIKKLEPDLAIIVPRWHGRDFLEWYREGKEFVPGMQVVVLDLPGEVCDADDVLHWDDWLDQKIWDTFTIKDLEWLRPNPLSVHELLPTSGTTGVPKLSQRTTLDWFHVHSVGIAERAGHTVYDSRILIGPLSGGSGRLWGVHVPLYTGGRSVYLTEFNEEAVLRITEEESATLWVWNPALITRVVTNKAFEKAGLEHLRQVSYSGAPMSFDVLAKLWRRNIKSFNVYGTSEVGGCMSPIATELTKERVLSAAGVPLEGFDVPVVDQDGLRLPAGQVGEILIWNIHHGYWDSPQESRETYHEEGSADDPWAGYQHTGDLGTYDQEGYLRIVGRKKDMILRGSQNIFPNEIEDLLVSHPDVRDIAIVGMPDSVLGERVSAFVVARAGSHPTVQSFAEYLDERGVAKFKWPERVEIVDALPLGPGGKVQKGVLRELLVKE